MSIKENRQREIQVHFRITSQEKNRILENMARCGIKDMGRFFRIMATDGCIFVIDDAEQLENLTYEINKIGVNINQIAHVANANGNISAQEINSLQEMMKKIWQLQRCILSEVPPYLQ